MKPTITVFTPTYNRAYCLHNGYEALCRQTLKDFVWLVVDDGSTDNTKELVESWQKSDNGFEIQYLYKTNGGLYSGYIAAINAIQTELCMCVDSDDCLTDNAIESVLDLWREYGSEKYAGVIGYDAQKNGCIIGEIFPESMKTINLIDTLLGRAEVKDADWKNIVRTELYREAIPSRIITDEFMGEKDFNPHYLHIKICEKYDFLVLNKVLCIVDYQPDGMTATVLKQYIRSPNSFRALRLLELTYHDAPTKFKIKKTIHYISSCILAKKPCFSASPQKILSVILYPIGVLFTLYLLIRNWKLGR